MASDKENVDAKKRAQQDMEDIARLKGLPAFSRYFVRRIGDKVGAQREKLLHDRNVPDERLGEERRKLWALEEVSTMLDSDQAAAQRVIDISPRSSDDL
jgi:DNA-directed RNA polymerase subunit F